MKKYKVEIKSREIKLLKTNEMLESLNIVDNTLSSEKIFDLLVKIENFKDVDIFVEDKNDPISKEIFELINSILLKMVKAD